MDLRARDMPSALHEQPRETGPEIGRPVILNYWALQSAGQPPIFDMHLSPGINRCPFECQLPYQAFVDYMISFRGYLTVGSLRMRKKRRMTMRKMMRKTIVMKKTGEGE
jgi:hypothetical protein